MNKKQSIILKDVSVKYRVANDRVGTFKEYIIRRMQGKIFHEKFYALKGINLAVEEGEIFGLIGHNGAGKSTMLKLIARVLTPTEGRIEVFGSVSPLLELGAGFHPEMSGRENVYLNGALLGFSKKEMDEKYHRIVEFAGLADFIEGPMRTYSSGMWARLGFAVATDTRPDILLVDEILAVGDEAFQKKCFDRINEFQKSGTTIFIVAHGMDIIQNMCQRVCWINQGQLMYIGDPETAIEKYRAGFNQMQ